jgi:adenylate cyclase
VLKLDWSKRTGEELRSLPHLIMKTATGQYFFPLVERERWTLGRDATCEIVLLDPLVSRRHAILTCSPTQVFYVIDLGSRNGSVVNGDMIQPMVQLHRGDRLRLGWTELEFYQS